MVKRYFILVLILFLLIPCLILPANATGEYDENISENVENIGSDLYSWFEQWYAYFLEATETVNDVSGAEALVTPFKKDLIEIQMFVWSWIGSVFDDIKTNVSRIEGYAYQIYQRMISLYNIVNNGFSAVLQYLKSLVTGDTTASDQFQEDMTPIETQVDEWVEEMETAPTFDEEGIDELLGLANDNVLLADDTGLLGALLTGLLTNSYIFTIVLFSVIFGLFGFLLYGKR